MTCWTRVSLLVIWLCLGGRVALALDSRDVPADAPADRIMAGPAEVAQAAEWAAAAFLAKGPQPPLADRPEGGGLQPLLASSALPFSFIYGGKTSAELLKGWHHASASKELPDRTRHDVAWIDPRSGLRVAAEVIVYKRYPAADWVLRFENTGKQATPIIENIQALDVTLATGDAQRPAVLHHLAGDDCSPRSFTPLESPLPAGGEIRLAPQGGRSSNGTFPFFNFEYQGRGLFTAVGWTGQWAASLDRGTDGLTRLRGGMERTHLLLHPGEAIRSPRILLMAWQGDRTAAHNRFRRLMLFHYTPKERSRPLAAARLLAVLRSLQRPSRLAQRGRAVPGRRGRRQERLRFPLARRRLVPRRFPQRRGQLVLQAQGVPQRTETGQRRLPQAGAEVHRLVRAGAGGRRQPDCPRTSRVRLRRGRGRAVQVERPGGPAVADRSARPADRRVRHGLVSQRLQHRPLALLAAATTRRTAKG